MVFVQPFRDVLSGSDIYIQFGVRIKWADQTISIKGNESDRGLELILKDYFVGINLIYTKTD